MPAHLSEHPEQPTINFPSDYLWDVIVVGAGPAGAMAAYHLSGYGYQVLLLDKQRFPRDKVCGDALIPDAINCLRRAGLYDPIREASCSLAYLRVYSTSRHVVDFPGEFLTIKRRTLDKMLVDAATARGATITKKSVESVSEDTNGVRVSCKGEPESLMGRIVLLATGADVSLLRKLHMVDQPRASATALRCYVRSTVQLDRLVASFDRSIIPGYAWIFPVGRDEYNIGCGIFYRNEVHSQVNLMGLFTSFLRDFPLAREMMASGEMTCPIKGARLRCGLSGASAIKESRILAIGETIGTTFPFTGEGIGKAMETGELASEIIHQAFVSGDMNGLSLFPIGLDQKLRPRYLGYKIAENWIANAWVNDLMVRRARKSVFLQNAVSGLLSEAVDPREIFSIRGMMKSFWK